jgi:hypothetical protein
VALPEITNYDPSVYEILVTDAVEGYNPSNPNTAANVGISNQAALNLANRTNWLYTNLNLLISGETIPATVAPLLSPEFTGTPEAPTPSLGDNSLKLSTTAFVQGTVNGLTAINVAGGVNVSLSAVQAGSGILNFTGALTANIAVILPNTSGKWIVENNTTGAFTLTVKTAAGTGVAVTQGKNQCVFGDGTNIYLASNDFSNLVLSGQPTTPTPPIGDQSLKIANTDFVWQFVDGAVNVPVGGGANVTLTPAQYGNGILLLQGALTAAISVELPSQSGQWIVANQTTGAFGLTMAVMGSAGAKATIPQGQSVIVYSDGTNVILAGAAASSSFSVHTFTATAGQTDFPCPYTPGNILVIQDGATLGSANYSATDGANVILNTGAPLNDEIQVIAFSSFTVANAVVRTGGTMLGALQLFGGDTGVTPALGDSSTKLATTAFVASGFAALAGLSTQEFSVAPATSANNALNLGQAFPSIGVSVSANALTGTLIGPTALSFRNPTLTIGSPVTAAIPASLSLTIPTGATLGTTAATIARLVWLVAYNGGMPVLCVTNLSGGLNLDETTLISPTTISAGATSANVIYSAIPVAANSPFRVVGFSDVTEAAAGTWASGPTTVQGIGGEALAGMSGYGYGQTMQIVTGSRSAGVNYVNTTARPITVYVSGQANGPSGQIFFLVTGPNGIQVTTALEEVAGAGYNMGISTLVGIGETYSVQVNDMTITQWVERR